MPDTPVYLCWNGNIVTNFPSFMLGSTPPSPPALKFLSAKVSQSEQWPPILVIHKHS